MIILRFPNGYGSAHKISGDKKRRRPWRARITDHWYFDIQQNKVIQKYRTLGYYATKKEALIALAEYNKNPLQAGTVNITFSDIFQLWRDINAPKMTARVLSGYDTVYKHSAPLHKLRMCEIKTDHMQNIINDCKQGYGTQNRMKTLWRKLYKLAMERDIVQKDYAQFVELTATNEMSDRKPFSKSQIKSLWDNLDKIKSVDLVLIMIYTGVRPSELLSIKLSDVNISDRYIHLKGTKTKASVRYIPIHSAILPLIKNRLYNQNYFIELNDKKMSYEMFLINHWRPAMSALGFDNIPYTTRHTAVSLMTEANMNEMIIKKIVGHSTGDITERYTHAYIDNLIQQIELIKAP